MLVLSRKATQRIVIPAHGITITLCSISGDRVRLGIDAPHHVAVHREEIWLAMEEEVKAARGGILDDELAEDAALINDPSLMLKLKG